LRNHFFFDKEIEMTRFFFILMSLIFLLGIGSTEVLAQSRSNQVGLSEKSSNPNQNTLPVVSKLPPRVVVDRLGIEFEYPDRFVAGRFQKEELPPSMEIKDYQSPLENAIVLVEPDQLMKFSAEEIPLGEIPVIWIDRMRDKKSRFMKSMLKEGYKKIIGLHEVYQLPGYPGPYGDAAYYYLLPLANGDILEFGAHKLFFHNADPSPATDYDQIIEKIITTLNAQ